MQVTGENANVTFHAPYNDVTGIQNNYNTYQAAQDIDLGRECCAFLHMGLKFDA